jgi:hypothetical protein
VHEIVLQEDEEASQIVLRSLLRDGVQIFTHCSVHSVSSAAEAEGEGGDTGKSIHASYDGQTINETNAALPVQMLFTGRAVFLGPASSSSSSSSSYSSTGSPTVAPASKHATTADRLLLAVGRRPTVAGLGLEAAHVKYTTARGIEVDDFMRTSNPLVYAAGDCCSQFQFTHAAGK